MTDLYPTRYVKDFVSQSELLALEQLVTQNIHSTYRDTGQGYSDNAGQTKYGSQLVAVHQRWKWDHVPEIKRMLATKLQHALEIDLQVHDSYILESHLPYLIHTDFSQVGHDQGHAPTYTVLIPLDTYDTCTVLFNESQPYSTDFERFKQAYTEEPTLRIDPKFCMDKLTHIHPRDLKYLTVASTHAWTQGCMIAFDRRRFHCSDNYLKKSIATKRAILLLGIEP